MLEVSMERRAIGVEGWKHLDLLRQIPIILNDNAGYDRLRPSDPVCLIWRARCWFIFGSVIFSFILDCMELRTKRHQRPFVT